MSINMAGPKVTPAEDTRTNNTTSQEPGSTQGLALDDIVVAENGFSLALATRKSTNLLDTLQKEFGIEGLSDADKHALRSASVTQCDDETSAGVTHLAFTDIQNMSPELLFRLANFAEQPKTQVDFPEGQVTANFLHRIAARRLFQLTRSEGGDLAQLPSPRRAHFQHELARHAAVATLLLSMLFVAVAGGAG